MSLVAHSAPPLNPAKGNQSYGCHASAVWDGATSAAEEVFTFARGGAAELVPTMRAAISGASAFHDLGKLGPENQAAMKAGRDHPLPKGHDHIDGGVAHAMNEPHRNLAAAWLIRAHHAPGLPDRTNEKYMDFGTLRGARNRQQNDQRVHKPVVENTDRRLSLFLKRHAKAWPDSPQITPGPAFHGLSLRLALSCLVDADHRDTAAWDDAPPVPPREACDWGELLARLDAYVGKIEKRDPARDELREQFFQHAGTADLAPMLLACEAGVGMGKTTTVLRWLLRKAQELHLRRIIIVAPYTNILRQTARTLRKALCVTPDEPDRWIAENHHRADFADLSSRQYAALWEAPIVLTTAVQFFETLSSNHPASLRKLHRLPGSAIFLDEAHAALPPTLWPQAWEWLTELAEQWSCPAVLASGSMFRFWEQPKMVSPARQLPELTPKAVAKANRQAEPGRVRFATLGTVSVETLVKRLKEDADNGEGPSLCILNTVQTAAVIACRLAEQLDGVDPLKSDRRIPLAKRRVLHLSTALSPRHRELILAEIEERTDNRSKGWILIATSCVEAGVDLDFLRGYRERCSVSAFIQMSGRINRHGWREDATQWDFQLLVDETVTLHPQFKTSRLVFEQLWPAIISHDKSPAELVTRSLEMEFELSGGLTETIRKHERENNYPKVAEEARVIQSDTRTVIVDREIAAQVIVGKPIPSSVILQNSVQLWSEKIGTLGMESIRRGSDLYHWPSRYDPELIGIMQGILPAQLGNAGLGNLIVGNLE